MREEKLVGGPTLVQTRRIVTDVPGPKSRELLARQRRAVPAGVGSALPVYVTHAGGGVVVDVDGNSLIDFGSGIAVTSVGNSAERVVARASRLSEDHKRALLGTAHTQGMPGLLQAGGDI